MTGADPANEIQGFTVEPGPVTLFCFSAATWNPHRIHTTPTTHVAPKAIPTSSFPARCRAP